MFLSRFCSPLSKFRTQALVRPRRAAVFPVCACVRVWHFPLCVYWERPGAAAGGLSMSPCGGSVLRGISSCPACEDAKVLRAAALSRGVRAGGRHALMQGHGHCWLCSPLQACPPQVDIELEKRAASSLTLGRSWVEVACRLSFRQRERTPRTLRGGRAGAPHLPWASG